MQWPAIVLAIHKGKPRRVSDYNAMDAARVFEALSRKVLGTQPLGYNESLYKWMLQRQNKKRRDNFATELEQFAVTDATNFQVLQF